MAIVKIYGFSVTSKVITWLSFILKNKSESAPSEASSVDIKDGVDVTLFKEIAAESNKVAPFNISTELPKTLIREMINISINAGVQKPDLFKVAQSAIYSLVYSITDELTADEQEKLNALMIRFQSYIDTVDKKSFFVVSATELPKVNSDDGDMDYSAHFGLLSTEVKREIGVMCLKNGQDWRKNRRGQVINLSLSSKNDFKIYMADENDKIERTTMTFTRAVCGTALELAEMQSNANPKQLSKIGVIVGWHALYPYADKIKRMFEMKGLMFEISYIPLVCIPRSRPTTITSQLPGSEYMFLMFAMMNDAYNIATKKQKSYNFTSDITRRLHNLKMSIDTTVIKFFFDRIYKLCLLKMKHRNEVDSFNTDVVTQIISTLEKEQVVPLHTI